MAKVCFILCLLALACRPVRDDIHEFERGTDSIVTVVEVEIRVDSVAYCPEDKVQSFLDTLQSFIGVTETTGRNDGPEIARMLAVCGMGEGNPWCAAYIALALTKNNLSPPNACAWSPSYFPESKIVWRKGESKLIPEGAVFGLWFNNLNRVAHVGVVVKDTGRGWVITMEGNTNADGSRDGNMAATRMRKKSQLYVASDWVLK
jgi:hypothetical protein